MKPARTPLARELHAGLAWPPAGALASLRHKIALGLTLTALLLLNTKLIWDWQVLQLESETLRQRRAELELAATSAASLQAPRSEAQTRWLAEKTAALNHPWPRLFERLEQRHPRAVWLRSLRAERGSGEVLLTARAATPERLLQWAGWLRAEPEVHELRVLRVIAESSDGDAEMQLQLRFVAQAGGAR